MALTNGMHSNSLLSSFGRNTLQLSQSLVTKIRCIQCDHSVLSSESSQENTRSAVTFKTALGVGPVWKLGFIFMKEKKLWGCCCNLFACLFVCLFLIQSSSGLNSCEPRLIFTERLIFSAKTQNNPYVLIICLYIEFTSLWNIIFLLG